MKIKRVLVLIMAICLSVALFAACGGEEGSSEATKSPASQSPASQAPASQSPATQAPATENPATEAPATENPATENPATENPTEEPTATPSASTATEVTDVADLEEEGEYKLTADISGDLNLSSGTYVIDLAGCEWDGNLTISGADVTIIDSETVKGSMTSSTNDVIILESGSLTVTEIEIYGNCGGCDGIFVKGGTAVINDCYIEALNAALQNKGGTMTVNGGQYTSSQNHGMKVNNNSFITINGAEVTGVTALNIGDNNGSYPTIEDAFVPGDGYVMEEIADGYEFVEG